MVTVTGADIVHLLNMVTCINHRKFNEDECSLWYQLLSEHSYDECYEAFQEYLKEDSEKFLTPSLIINRIKANRVKRITNGLNAIEPPNGVDGKEYLAWLNQKKVELSQPPAGFKPSSLAVQQGVKEHRAIS